MSCRTAMLSSVLLSTTSSNARVRVRVGVRAGVRVRVCLDALGTERNLVVGLVRVTV